MTPSQSKQRPQLFYSYCHHDAEHRTTLDKHLAILKNQKLLCDWHDQRVIPGRHISKAIRRQMRNSQIFVFLFSPDFIASKECMKEWSFAKSLAEENPAILRIPVIVRPCRWQDVLEDDDVRALPIDGQPLTDFDNLDTGWNQVSEGIKQALDYLRSQFVAKQSFLKNIERTDFVSQQHITLRDLYVFPRLRDIDNMLNPDTIISRHIDTVDDLLHCSHNLVYGPDRIGKTALARYLYLTLLDRNRCSLYIDLMTSARAAHSRVWMEAFNEQFTGDYELWIAGRPKTLIVDNFSYDKHSLRMVEAAKTTFDQIIAVTHSDVFYTFLKDEPIVSHFRYLEIQAFTHAQQEELIKTRLGLSESIHGPGDGGIDQIEEQVNSIILSKRILPRYAFYILSILQTLEGYMPGNMSITSYGHCYQALIVASLIRSGIRETDEDLNTCFNLAEELAFARYRYAAKSRHRDFDFSSFIQEYKSKFLVCDSMINRLKHSDHGIIDSDGRFRSGYMYYFFLGRFLSRKSAEGELVLSEICENSHREENYLTLLFTIHHTNDNSIIDDILVRTMCALDTVSPAVLNGGETRRFSGVIAELPEAILAAESVEAARRREREARDEVGDDTGATDEEVDSENDMDAVNGMYRILKNNKIMGQVLRNRYGALEKARVEEIVEIIADSGLRLVNLVLADEMQIAQFARYYSEKYPGWDMDMVKKALAYLSFIWTMINVEEVVGVINIRGIQTAVKDVVARKDTPAYDMIAYFLQLDGAQELTRAQRDGLAALLRKYDDVFVRRIVSLRTQHYMNTHRSSQSVEQSICDLLGIRYVPRVLRSA